MFSVSVLNNRWFYIFGTFFARLNCTKWRTIQYVSRPCFITICKLIPSPLKGRRKNIQLFATVACIVGSTPQFDLLLRKIAIFFSKKISVAHYFLNLDSYKLFQEFFKSLVLLLKIIYKRQLVPYMYPNMYECNLYDAYILINLIQYSKCNFVLQKFFFIAKSPLSERKHLV